MALNAGAKAIYSKPDFWRFIAGLILFSAAFGYVEAAVVVYLRSIYTPVRAHFYSVPPDQVFPLLSVAQLRSLGPEHVARLRIELGRELATLLMLAGAAMVAARSLREWVAAFVLCFGVWDITFYMFLKLLIDWPASVLTWDILFLIPVPWTGPVIAPVITSSSMIGSGLLLLRREYSNKPVHMTALEGSGIVLGGAFVIAAFMWDFRNTASGEIQTTLIGYCSWWVKRLGCCRSLSACGADVALGPSRRRLDRELGSHISTVVFHRDRHQHRDSWSETSGRQPNPRLSTGVYKSGGLGALGRETGKPFS